jgi:hypothetical protein
MKEKFQQLKKWYLEHERHIGTGALVFGFILDNLTLTRIDRVFDNTVILTYLFLIGGALLCINLAQGGVFSEQTQQRIQSIFPVLLQFAFGGIFSAFFIFYSRSGTLVSSWPFILFLLGLLIGNESFRQRYTRLRFQVVIFFTTLFSFFVYFVPVVTKIMNPWIFLVSGALSLLSIVFFIQLLGYFLPQLIQRNKKWFTGVIGSIFVLLNILYFANIIPPIPLALKDIHLAHSVVRSGDDYILAVEETSFLKRWFTREVYHYYPGESAFVFSSVFAPADLDTKIRQCWEYFNTQADNWEQTGCIVFPISGGRDGGYRGYSRKTFLFEGKWRVNVETERGQLIGRVTFFVEEVFGAVQTKELVR